MSIAQFPVLLVALPLLFVPVAFLVYEVGLSVRGFCIGSLTVVTGLACLPVLGSLTGMIDLPLDAFMGGWGHEVGIVLSLDMLSALLLPISNVVVLLAAAIGLHEREHIPIPYFSLWLLLAAGTNGLILTSDLFNAYVFLEITSISAHALVAYRGDGYAFESAFKYLVAGLVGSAFLLWGIIALFAATGALSLSIIAARITAAPATLVAAGFALILCGLFVKLAIVPFHIWKPDGLSGAPASTAGALSGAVLSAALVILLRITVGVAGLVGSSAVEVSFAEPLRNLLFIFGLASIAVGHTLALVQNRLTRLLAYSSVGHFGAILLALSSASTAAVGALIFHAMNHAIMKSGLFFLAAGAKAERGTDRIAGLAGYLRNKPIERISCAIFMLALIGVPPTAGFAGKWALITELVTGESLFAAVAVALGGIAAVPYYLRTFTCLATGHRPNLISSRVDPRKRITRIALCLGSVYILAAFALAGTIVMLAESAVVGLIGGAQ